MDQKVYHCRYEICMSPFALTLLPVLSLLSFPPKEGIVLCCLIVLGSRINEFFLRVCACWSAGLHEVFSSNGNQNKKGEWMVMTERGTGWKNGKKMNMDLKVVVQLKEGRRNRRAKSKVREREENEGGRSSNRGRLFWGLSIEAISTDWLCYCVTQSRSQETLCVEDSGGGLRASAVVKTGGHAPLLDTLQQSHIVKPQSPQRERHHFVGFFFFFLAPPPCSQFTIVFVWAHKRVRQWLFNETGEQSMCCVYGERFSFGVLPLEALIKGGFHHFFSLQILRWERTQC